MKFFETFLGLSNGQKLRHFVDKMDLKNTQCHFLYDHHEDSSSLEIKLSFGSEIFCLYNNDTGALNSITISYSDETDKLKIEEYLNERNISEPLIRFLGASKKEIIDLIGKPQAVRGDILEYRNQFGTFFLECYDFDDYECSQISVFGWGGN